MILALVVVVASAAAGDELPRVAAQPLVTVGLPDASQEALRTVFLSAVARQPVAMVSSFAVDAFLEKRGGQGCGFDEACLLELCQQTQADFSISVTVQRDAGQWSLRGRTLSCSGLLSREVPQGRLSVADGPDAQVKVEAQLELLVRHLVSGDPLPQPEPAKVAEVVPTPDVPRVEPQKTLTPAPKVAPPVVVAAPGQPAWVRPTTTGLWVVAVAAGGSAAALGLTNVQESHRLRSTVVDGNLPAGEVHNQAALYDRGVVAVGLAAGAATAAGSALLVQALFGREEVPR